MADKTGGRESTAAEGSTRPSGAARIPQEAVTGTSQPAPTETPPLNPTEVAPLNPTAWEALTDTDRRVWPDLTDVQRQALLQTSTSPKSATSASRPPLPPQPDGGGRTRQNDGQTPQNSDGRTPERGIRTAPQSGIRTASALLRSALPTDVLAKLDATPPRGNGDGDLILGETFEDIRKVITPVSVGNSALPTPAPEVFRYDPTRVYPPPTYLTRQRQETGLVGELESKTFSTFRPDPRFPSQARALAICERFVMRFDPEQPDCGVPGLTLYSPELMPGVGKSHLMAAIGNALLARRYASVRFCTLKQIFREIKATFGKTSDVTAMVIERYKSPRVILLDDCGKEPRQTEFELSEWFALVDEWVNRGTRVIRTTNDTTADSLRKYGPPTVSRLMGLCASAVIEMDGDDYRSQGAGYEDFFAGVGEGFTDFGEGFTDAGGGTGQNETGEEICS